MPILVTDLAKDVGRRYGSPVEMMQLKHGIFDDASISLIASDTVREIGRLASQNPDVRRFRPNVAVSLLRSTPFQEDEWLGGELSFGKEEHAPAIAITMRDVRCSMVNFDPDTANASPEVMRAVVRANQNNAGVYGTVTRIAQLRVGQTVFLRAGSEKRTCDRSPSMKFDCATYDHSKRYPVNRADGLLPDRQLERRCSERNGKDSRASTCGGSCDSPARTY